MTPREFEKFELKSVKKELDIQNTMVLQNPSFFEDKSSLYKTDEASKHGIAKNEKSKQVRSKIYSKKKINMNSNEDIKSALKAQSSATEMKSMNSKTRQL